MYIIEVKRSSFKIKDDNPFVYNGFMGKEYSISTTIKFCDKCKSEGYSMVLDGLTIETYKNGVLVPDDE